MIDGKTVLAIIPAREGSKRVPLKNITLFQGLPLIQHAIDHAAASKYIDQTIIVSDADSILIFGKPPVITLREPKFLAGDFGTSEAVIAWTLYHYANSHDIADYFVLLQPTSPLRTAQDIDACIERATTHDAGQCISYNRAGKRNGAVYVSRCTTFLSTMRLEDLRFGAAFYVMPDERSLDIDYPQDFQTAAK